MATGNFDAVIHDENYAARYGGLIADHRSLFDPGDRPRESLNGIWRFAIDPYDHGLRQGWQDPAGWNGDKGPWDYTPDDGEKMPVPSCWNTIRPEYLYYEGGAWYARRFEYRLKREGERVFLRFGAANYEAMIFLNGEHLGTHRGGSTPFCLEMTGRLAATNVLQIRIDNTRRPDRVPARNTDWFNYGGLYRGVELYRMPATFVKSFKARLVPDGGNSGIAVSVVMDGPANTGAARVRIPALGVDAAVTVAKGRGEAVIAARPELWSPDHPRLYDIAVEYAGDRLGDRIGFRRIETAGTEILLNGRPIFLRGICVHEDDIRAGKVSDEADLRRRFRHAKELGCNFLRLAHYPHTELAARLADELGFLLWEEIPVYWAVDFSDSAVYADAENQLCELIERDGNRAAVIIWSVGNENPDTDARLDFMSRMAQKAKELDSSRLVAAACLVDRDKLVLADRLAAHLDVIGLNEYYGWYNPDFAELVRIGENSRPGKPVIISETGADALAGHHGAEDELFTEEHMAAVYRRQVETIEKIPYVRGLCPWILYDFRSPRRWNMFQRGYNRKGLIAADKRRKKAAFAVLREFYRRKAGEI